jgi:hypothetical protein
LKLRFGSIPLSRKRMTDDRWDQMVRCSLPLASRSHPPPSPALPIPSFHRLLGSRLLVQDIGLHQIQIPGPVSPASHARREDSQEPLFSMPSSPIKCSRCPQSFLNPVAQSFTLSKPKARAIIETRPGQVLCQPIKPTQPLCSAHCRSTYCIAAYQVY